MKQAGTTTIKLSIIEEEKAHLKHCIQVSQAEFKSSQNGQQVNLSLFLQMKKKTWKIMSK